MAPKPIIVALEPTNLLQIMQDESQLMFENINFRSIKIELDSFKELEKARAEQSLRGVL